MTHPECPRCGRPWLGVQLPTDEKMFCMSCGWYGHLDEWSPQKKFYCSQGDFQSDNPGKCPTHGYTLHERGKVLVLDDNPVSIASYVEEYGDDLK